MAASLGSLGLISAATAARDEVKNVNPGNKNVSVTHLPGAAELKWPNVRGAVAWWVYHAEEGVDDTAESLCAERPNARRLAGRDARSVRIDNLRNATRYEKGSIEYDHMRAPRLCLRGDKVRFGADAREHLFTGLDNGRTYTFLVAVQLDLPNVVGNCNYMDYFTQTPRKIDIRTVTNKNPVRSRTTPGDRQV
ncbi:MAG: hypothetical protein ACR2P7_04880 [bacterium]